MTTATQTADYRPLSAAEMAQYLAQYNPGYKWGYTRTPSTTTPQPIDGLARCASTVNGVNTTACASNQSRVCGNRPPTPRLTGREILLSLSHKEPKR
jgi:hypothetical protein